jgi:glycerophosphoryl diester phosphodiesterase
MPLPSLRALLHPLNIAHRGARSLAPENTLPAATKAVAAKAHMWELDVQLTSDGVPVVFHDDHLQRTTNIAEAAYFADRKPWAVWNFTLEELRTLDAGSWFVTADPFGRIAANQVSREDCRSYLRLAIPTLGEALALTKESGLLVNVEIKDLKGLPGHQTVVEKTLAQVEMSGLLDQVLFSSFNHDYMARMREINSRALTAVLVENETPRPLVLLKTFKAMAYHPRIDLIMPQAIRELRQEGFLVNVWTVNDLPSMRNLLLAGATGIITDFPQLLDQVLKERPYRV